MCFVAFGGREEGFGKMTREKGKLEFGIAYNLIIENEEMEGFLFVGRRKRINTRNLNPPQENHGI